MKIIVCGAGEIGMNVARYLSNEGHSITVIDSSPVILDKIIYEIGVKTVLGNAASPSVLREAQAQDCDLILAVTSNDETNLLISQISEIIFKIPTKIIRVRNNDFLEPKWAEYFKKIGIFNSEIINPEKQVAVNITDRISIPMATTLYNVAKNKLVVLGILCREGCSILNEPLSQLNLMFPTLNARIFGINREGQFFNVDKNTKLIEDDEVFLVVAKEHMNRLLKIFGFEEEVVNKIVIQGINNTSEYLVELLLKSKISHTIKVIDFDKNRTEYFARKFNNSKVIVIDGDPRNRDTIISANIHLADTVISMFNDDELNISISMLAKSIGAKYAMTKINNSSYNSINSFVGIDAFIIPSNIVISSILGKIRSSYMREIYSIGDNFGEVVELAVSASSKILGKAIKDLNLPSSVDFITIIRNNKNFYPKSDSIFELDDIVLVFLPSEFVNEIEKLFTNQIWY